MSHSTCKLPQFQYHQWFTTSSNVTLNAGKIAAIDEAGMEHDSDDSNVIHIKMKVGDFLLDSVHFKFELFPSRGSWSVRRTSLFLLRMFSRWREEQEYVYSSLLSMKIHFIETKLYIPFIFKWLINHSNSLASCSINHSNLLASAKT